MTNDDKTSIVSADQVKHLPGSESALNGTDKIRIMVVEDDISTQMLYEKGLFDQVFDKKMIASGKDALRVYREWHPDIIILDIYLPEMSGYHVLKEIRTTINDKNTVIVMATSQSRSHDITSCMELGIEGYMVKPFSLREIGVKILGYYAKKEPERAQKADALCQNILKQSPIRTLLDKDKSIKKEDTKSVSNCTADTETGAAEGEKEEIGTSEKLND